MKGKKVHSGSIDIHRPISLVKRRKHCSLVLNLDQEAKLGAYACIDAILNKVHAQLVIKHQYIIEIQQIMKEYDQLGGSYFALQRPEPNQITNTVDEEPPAEEMKSITVVPPGYLREMVKVPAKVPPELAEMEMTERLVVQKQEKDRRDSIIHDCKKEYLHTKNSKYLSQSMAIEESRADFKEEDLPLVEQLRRNLKKKKDVLSKKSTKNVKYWTEDTPRPKENKPPSSQFKNKKAFIDTIDPTSSYYNKTVTASKDEVIKHSKNNKKRGSMYMNDTPGSESRVTAKVISCASSSFHSKPCKEKIVFRDTRQSTFNVKLPTICDNREQLGRRVDMSVGSNSQIRLRQVDNVDKRTRQFNSISVVSLPSIKR